MTDEELLDSGQSDDSASSNTLSNIIDFAQKGSAIYKNVAGGTSSPTAANTQARTAAAPVNWQKYLPWAIGGVVLLIVLGMVFRRK